MQATKNFSWFLLLCLLPVGILAGGCQQLTPSASDWHKPPHGQKEAPEYGCAYFYFLWGRQAELEQRYDEALEAYQKALICDPKAEYISEKMPIVLLRLNRADEAVAWLESYLKKHPDASGSRLLLAKVYMKLGRIQEASEEYLKVHELQPEDDTPLLLLADMYMSVKKNEEAVEILKKILPESEQRYAALIMLARIERSKKDYKQALAYYEEALQKNWSAELLFEVSEMYVRQKEYEKAIAVYRRVLKREEDNETARAALIHIYLLQGKEERALEELRRLKEISDNPAPAVISIAKIYARQGKTAKAIATLKKLADEQEDSEARYLLAILYFQDRKFDSALAELQLIPVEAAEYKDRVFLEVRILGMEDKIPEAIAVLEKAVQRPETRSSDMFVQLAALYQQEGQTAASRKTFAKALELYPDDADLLYEFGLFLDDSKEMDEAMKVMQRVIGLDSNHAAALNYVGYTWADKNVHLEKAYTYIQKAVQLKPDNGYIRDSLGWVLYRMGKYQEAVKELRKALELTPDDPAILEHLGDAQAGAGEFKKALESYQRSYDGLKEEEARERLKTKIDSLQKQETNK